MVRKAMVLKACLSMSLTRTLFIVYYRVYTEYCVIPCKTPTDPCNLYLTCILARSIPPSHTVTSLKHHLSQIECITNHRCSRFFSGISSQSGMDDSSCLSLLKNLGLWSMPQELLVLVNKWSWGEMRFRISLESSEA